MTRKIKSFVYGMGSVLDLRPSSELEEEIVRLRQYQKDRDALERDWHMVGNDIFRSMRRFEKEERVICE